MIVKLPFNSYVTISSNKYPDKLNTAEINAIIPNAAACR